MAQEPHLMANSLTQRVASEVRAELGRRQLSQRALGEILNVHQSQISKRLIGRELSFTTAELDLIAEAWGIPVDRFLTAPVATAGAS